MKSTRRNLISTLFLGITLSVAAACGSDGAGDPTEGNSFLTIVGDSNVFLEYGVQRVITVRYHDSDDQPLAGQVSFEVGGNAAGTTLSAASGVTNNQGLAEVIISAGQNETAFEITASAAYAANTKWNVAVSAGTPPLSLVGAYNVDSTFDVVSGLPGGIGNAINAIIDMTDGPNDPATYLLDLLEDKLSSPFDNILSAARPGLDSFLNAEIKSRAPGFVNDLLAMANDLGEIARKFGTDSIVTVTENGVEGMVASHMITGFHFRIDNVAYGFTNAELGVDDVTVAGIGVSSQNGRANLTSHDMPVQYGGFLAMALESVIIPLIDPTADSLEALLFNNINCAAVGQAISNFLGFGSAGLYEGVCITGVAAGADVAIDALIDIDDSAQVVLQIAGEARINDTTGDRKVDQLTQGKWTGAIQYIGESGQLAADANTFTGTRR